MASQEFALKFSHYQKGIFTRLGNSMYQWSLNIVEGLMHSTKVVLVRAICSVHANDTV